MNGDGSYTFKACATRNAEIACSDLTNAYIIDATAPSIEINSTNPKTTYDASDNINVHVIDDNFDRVEINSVDSTTPTTKIYTEQYFGLWWLQDGTYTMTAYDKAGNTKSYTFTTDRTAPIVSLNTVTASTSKPTITGKVDDANAVVTLTIGGTKYMAANNGNGTWQYIVTSALSNGTYPLSVTATDTAGNVSTSATGTLIIAVPQATASAVTPQVLGVTTNTNGSGTTVTATTSATTDGTTSDDTTTTPQVLAAEDTKAAATTTKADTTKDDSKNVGKILGLKWFWWLVILAAVVGLWWLIAAWRSRTDEEN